MCISEDEVSYSTTTEMNCWRWGGKQIMKNKNKTPSLSWFCYKLLLHSMMSNAYLGCQGNHPEVTISTSLWICLVIWAKTHQKGESWVEIPKCQKSLKKKVASKREQTSHTDLHWDFFLCIVCSHIPRRILALKRCVCGESVKYKWC